MAEKMKEPVSMFVLFAKMFSITAKNLEKEFGEKGLNVLAESVKEFGMERGKDIAARAHADGADNTLEQYLSHYDMGRSEEFGYQTVYESNEIHQEFKQCVFAKAWMDAGQDKYGRIYCENIDPAIVTGYNQDMECIHEHIMYDHGHCTFCFRMKKK